MRLLAILLLAALPIAAVAADRVARPDPKLTPGAVDHDVTQANVSLTICMTGYTARVRNVPESVKLAVFREYGIDPKRSGEYEVDHLISLENGGSNDIRNLWPQPYGPKPGAREKDVLETHLKRLVCAGTLPLAEDQRALAGDWYAAYLKYGLDKAKHK
jgi:hypothetical protein